MSNPVTIPVIAIDGPTASGKGTIATRVAQALGFGCLDSGALYRIVGLLAIEAGINLADGPALAGLADGLDPDFLNGRVYVNQRDLTDLIRTEAVGSAASQVAAVPALRVALLNLQRRQRRLPGLVADGRDMGTVVFPDAALKVYLEADVTVRAQRRYKQLIEKGVSANIDSLLLALKERDARDQGRDCAPLVAAKDACILDSTQLTIDEVVECVLHWYRGHQASGPSA